MTESFGAAIIDTACTRTVCGQEWLDDYVTGLSQSKLNVLIKTEEPSCRPFRFGDGKVVYSTKRLKIPAKIGQTSCHIETHVVPANIPLLLSKASMKRAGTVLDMENDKAVMFNKPVKLYFTSSGHYCVNIIDNKQKGQEESQCENEILINSEEMSSVAKHKILLKLHKQFGHAFAEKQQRLPKSAGNKDTECDSLLKKIVGECEICQRYSKTSPRPAVGLPLASQYNETVAVDLHELEPGVWYLHIIDEFTRFSAGSVLTTKKSSEILKHFVHDWISVHGPPQKLFSDNGGEFNNDEVRDMAENFNIEIKTTAGYSPWSNGLLEQHNQTLSEIIMKVKSSYDCDWSTAVDWALMAKNTMQSVLGYSPYQLVFGQNPNLPSILIDKPPALEGTTKSEWVAKHISALHASRKAFTEAECSERIRRALRKQIRHTDEKYETGDKVYYKQVDCQEWKGPGVVIGQDGAVVFVRHGGTCIRVHRLRLKKKRTENMDQNVTKGDYEDDTNLERRQITIDNNTVDTEDTVPEVQQSMNQVEPAALPTRMQKEPEHLTSNNTRAQNPVEREIEANLKMGQIVTYRDKDGGILHTAKVLGRAGKVKGKYRNWFNLQFIEPTGVAGTTDAVDMSGVEDLQVEMNMTDTNATDEHEDVFVTKDVSFHLAKHEEIKNWTDNNVFEEVKDEGQKCISTRWVCTLKDTSTGQIPKARLVARGFEELEVSELQKDSPTCASESLRLLLAVICQRQWTLHSMDIKSAFLQGKRRWDSWRSTDQTGSQ
ncbi:CD166 antigen homolog A isoform X1 [Trachinotus anak]|uniref:CD166 antigen homolog A isoform X1 n=1 Tax=Trachinotus anak TaxID=443729 RepID=UPI0039F1923D